MRAKNTIRLLLLVVSIAGGIVPADAAGKWWSRRWANRVAVTFPASSRGGGEKRTRLAGDDVGVVTFHHAGLAQKDGRDIRVVTTRGKDVPCRVLMMGPGDRCRVAFALQPDVPTYYVYFHSPTAKPPKEKLDIRRGVLLEMWPYAGGQANNPRQALRTFERSQAKPPLGAKFLDRIFNGLNPFGPQPAIVAQYTAWFQAPKEGEYDFATSSTNASFLTIDDTLVVRNGGWHGPQRDIRKRGKIKLTAGLHKLRFLQVSPWGYPIAVVVWKAPGGKWKLIPPRAFPPVARGQAGPVEYRGRQVNIDFIVLPGGEVFLENRYFQRRNFRARIQGHSGRKIVWRWEFGDGLSAEGQAVEHVFLTPGVYAVKLTGSGYRRPLEITHRVEIDRPWSQQAYNRLERVRDFAKQVATYDLAKLLPRANAEAVLLFRRAREPEAMRKACEVFARRRNAEGKDIETVLPIYVDSLSATGRAEDMRKAVGALEHAATMTDHVEVGVDMLLRAVAILLGPMNEPDEAMTLCRRAMETYSRRAAPKSRRRMKIAVGDVWRVRGNRAKADQAYQDAGVVDKRAKEHPAMVRGDFARQVEGYLRSRDWDAAGQALDSWEQTFPADTLEGYSTLLRVKRLTAENRHAAAARQAETLVKVNPHSPYAAELLMWAYKAYRILGQEDQAKRTLQRLATDYRESPQARKVFLNTLLLNSN